jgi:hypothetical protein
LRKPTIGQSGQNKSRKIEKEVEERADMGAAAAAANQLKDTWTSKK